MLALAFSASTKSPSEAKGVFGSPIGLTRWHKQYSPTAAGRRQAGGRQEAGRQEAGRGGRQEAGRWQAGAIVNTAI